MEASVNLFITSGAAQQLRSISKEVSDKLYKNFIRPVQLEYLVESLEGKYKPSWEIPISNTCPFRLAMASVAREHNLFHYHFGYKFYKDGKDAKYPGKVSESIVHTQFESSATGGNIQQSHTIIRVDQTHPTPFTIPTSLEDKIFDMAITPK